MAATFVVYGPAMRNGFVWDDTALVLRDPLIRSWRLIPEGFQHFLFLDATGSNFYRPMQRLTFVGDYALWGFGNPGGWHFTSVLLHALAGCALYTLLREWLGEKRRGIALGVAVLWAIHPLHTSAVTYVAGRADLLAALFGFTGLWLAWRSTMATKRSAMWSMGAAACLLGAMLSKESGAMASVLCLGLLIWRRIPRSEWTRWALLLVLIFGTYLGLRNTAQRTPPPPARAAAKVDSTVVLASRALADYAGLVVAPVTLRMERDVSTPAAQSTPGQLALKTGVGLGLALLLGAWAWWASKTLADAAAALAGAGIAYLPISNLIPLNATLAEHWLYVPSAYFFTAAALTLAQLSSARWLLPIFVLWTAALGLRTARRQHDWVDQRTFLTATIAAGGDSARMLLNLGNLEFAEGNLAKAMEDYEAALKKSPDLVFTHMAIAAVALKQNDVAGAREALARCDGAPGFDAEKLRLRTAIDYAEHKGDPVPGYRAAAAASPLNWSFQQRYFTALAQTGRLIPAIGELRRFIVEQDFRAESWQLLADFLAQAGQAEAAAAAHAQAMRRDVWLR